MLLTMIVSLAAIFLSTFVLIIQTGPTRNARSWPTTQWRTIEQEERQNQQLLNLSNQILELTTAIHSMNLARSPTGPNGTEQAARSSIGNAMGNDQQ